MRYYENFLVSCLNLVINFFSLRLIYLSFKNKIFPNQMCIYVRMRMRACVRVCVCV